MGCLFYLQSRTYAETVVTEVFNKMYFYVINIQKCLFRGFSYSAIPE